MPPLATFWESDAAALPVASSIVEHWRGSHEDPLALALLAYALGGFIGEALRRTYGGHWAMDPPTLMPAVEKDGSQAFPIDTARRALLADGDSGLVGYLEQAAATFGAPLSG